MARGGPQAAAWAVGDGWEWGAAPWGWGQPWRYSRSLPFWPPDPAAREEAHTAALCMREG